MCAGRDRAVNTETKTTAADKHKSSSLFFFLFVADIGAGGIHGIPLLPVVFVPLISFLAFVCFSTYVNAQTLIKHTLFGRAWALLALALRVATFIKGNVISSSVGVWASSALFDLTWTFTIDALTYVRLLVVLTVSTLVHLYSTEYRSEDPHLARFLSYLSLFTFFRLLLITADNYIGLFLG